MTAAGRKAEEEEEEFNDYYVAKIPGGMKNGSKGFGK